MIRHSRMEITGYDSEDNSVNLVIPKAVLYLESIITSSIILKFSIFSETYTKEDWFRKIGNFGDRCRANHHAFRLLPYSSAMMIENGPFPTQTIKSLRDWY